MSGIRTLGHWIEGTDGSTVRWALNNLLCWQNFHKESHNSDPYSVLVFSTKSLHKSKSPSDKATSSYEILSLSHPFTHSHRHIQKDRHTCCFKHTEWTELIMALNVFTRITKAASENLVSISSITTKEIKFSFLNGGGILRCSSCPQLNNPRP